MNIKRVKYNQERKICLLCNLDGRESWESLRSIWRPRSRLNQGGLLEVVQPSSRISRPWVTSRHHVPTPPNAPPLWQTTSNQNEGVLSWGSATADGRNQCPWMTSRHSSSTFSCALTRVALFNFCRNFPPPDFVLNDVHCKVTTPCHVLVEIKPQWRRQIDQ